MIDHILRRDLAELTALADHVETIHAGEAVILEGLSVLLVQIEQEIKKHMPKKEQILFPQFL